ncbi:hypothetical protein BEL04_11340 [Mucilaginibacter sp. PPCGB 2223]|uniref:hypothetical protein n=1 Tax=Mucilaginibacter sp. PPCGB 2223 TaxID=1886027 RepID=UPI000825CD33|nr:hypothetical protein [Mucilaginibacter sp. PPCGB 2223]OCX52087.1 hypothetical protein BEL04_11340 [Mucilaginibacter sp. PPCGB 2223]
MNLNRYNILLILLTGIIFNDVYAQNAPVSKQKEKLKVVKVEPPVFGFYGKSLMADSIIVRAPKRVSDDALVLAGMKIQVMLKYMPAVRHNLIQRGAEMHIIASNQETSDLPEYRELKGKPYKDNRGLMYKSINDRARGLGDIYACCPEENLLRFYGDNYGSYDVCAHEFAHVVMDFGLDQSIRNKIIAQFHKSISKGLWKNEYAATNPQEYWAEMSIYYFGANPKALNKIKGPEVTNGPDALREYDEGGYNLVDSIYNSMLQPAIINMQPALKVADNSNLYVYNNTKRAELTVVNDTGKKLSIYSDNMITHGSEVSPYLHRTLTVWAMQVVKIQDEQGKILGYYKAVGANCLVRISD